MNSLKQLTHFGNSSDLSCSWVLKISCTTRTSAAKADVRSVCSITSACLSSSSAVWSPQILFTASVPLAIVSLILTFSFVICTSKMYVKKVLIYTAHFQKISNALSTSCQYFATKVCLQLMPIHVESQCWVATLHFIQPQVSPFDPPSSRTLSYNEIWTMKWIRIGWCMAICNFPTCEVGRRSSIFLLLTVMSYTPLSLC